MKSSLDVTTPLGKGSLQNGRVEGMPTRYIVRLPVNETTAQHLHDENCITPKATLTGLWWFTPDQLT
jgi:hypothetical protein